MACESADDGLTAPDGLRIAGRCPSDNRTVLLISPDGPRFWQLFIASPEFADGDADPMDRWSHRVIGTWADTMQASAVFPSDGPPYPPFVGWALASGRCWSSPTGLLVHDTMGLLVSFRGAVILPRPCAAQPMAASPCLTCPRPCVDACPALAFAGGFDATRCHIWLDGKAGTDCMNDGCRVRLACPISSGCGRLPEQSAWHMRQYHP